MTELIQPHQLVIFQFKHKVTARVGQKEARRQLLALYTCTSQAHPCELHRLLQNKKPGAYVLLTNVEVNAQFRTKFIRACEQHCPAISHYQIIGLDELEMWVRSEVFVEDGINNVYSTIIPNDIVDWLLSYPEKTLKWPF